MTNGRHPTFLGRKRKITCWKRHPVAIACSEGLGHEGVEGHQDTHGNTVRQMEMLWPKVARGEASAESRPHGVDDSHQHHTHLADGHWLHALDFEDRLTEIGTGSHGSLQA